MTNRIPLDPQLPANFDNTPNDKRSTNQLDCWWDHPYGITQANGKIMVRCLNGGAWDRSTALGIADSYDEACLLAASKQAEWVARRAEPIFLFSIDPPFVLVRQPQRPDHDQVIIAEFATKEELALYEMKTVRSEHVDVAPTLDISHMNLEQLAWYNNQLDLSVSRLINESTAIKALQKAVVDRMKEMKEN
ncbi:Uncharacterised protein [Enterobacter hormaechei]|uniref:DNA-binding protein n=1 Tax=Enterobacter hormaechei TaxID=158836 RepID=UPI0012557331|nr:DNA-binding protein [Enterobacter hormaechei]VAE21712.1 Uncharacterised protein [Enterobacter hormaechei]VAE26746.1 Uncharacterised protein [Enterobacter hormaechei]